MQWRVSCNQQLAVLSATFNRKHNASYCHAQVCWAKRLQVQPDIGAFSRRLAETGTRLVS